MSIDIAVEGLCKKCRDEHEIFEANAGRTMPVQEALMCQECKEKNGLVRPVAMAYEKTPVEPEGDNPMRKKRKYTKRDDVATSAASTNRTVRAGAGKPAKLDKETKKFIKHLVKSGKKAAKLEAKADKLQARADDLRDQAATMKAGMEALKAAVEDVA